MTNAIFNRIDPEIIARLKDGVRYEHKSAKRVKPNRKAKSYRAARRNVVLRGDKPMIWEGAPAKRRGAFNNGEDYRPNGERERARRARQIKAGSLRAENGVVA